VILREWLETRAQSPPPRLLYRIVEVLGTDADADASPDRFVDLFIGAAERLLRDLTAQSALGRDAALDLLTADALATYALECAAASPEMLLDTTARAIERFGAIVQ